MQAHLVHHVGLSDLQGSAQSPEAWAFSGRQQQQLQRHTLLQGGLNA